MGTYLEKNVQAFTDLQTKLAEQSKNVTPEVWAQFMNVQSPLTMIEKMQEQMAKQTEQMLGAFGIKK
ncbi:MAG: phaR [Ramlibacter sp.]|nr:phaR [Ramlibacter sp.]